MRALVIGDVAGHLGSLRWALGAHGADLARARLPDGLFVVQVGDLVHRGPDSAGVIALVDRFLRGPDAGRWIQLIGNHEQPYLFHGTSPIRRRLDKHSATTLGYWWADGLAQTATALTPDWQEMALPHHMRLPQPSGDILVSHAGLTHGAWLALGRPGTAEAAAAAMNADARGDAEVTLHRGLLTTGEVDLEAGPLWALAGPELLGSWDRTTDAEHLNQAHGHTTVRAWSRERWWPGAEAIIDRGDLIADKATRQELARIGGRLIWGIDPGHLEQPAPTWQPLLVPLAAAPQTPSVSSARRTGWHIFHWRGRSA
jgi:hypothetical protein